MLGVGSRWNVSEERVALWPRGSGHGRWPHSTWDGSEEASSLQLWPREGEECPLPHSGRGPSYPFGQGGRAPALAEDDPGASWLVRESGGVFGEEENLSVEGGGAEVAFDPLGVTAHWGCEACPTYEDAYVQAGDYLLSRSEAARAGGDAEEGLSVATLYYPPQDAGEVCEDCQEDGGDPQAASDASPPGLDNPALEDSEETRARVGGLALGDGVRSRIDDALSRIDDTRARLNRQRRRPLSDGAPPAAGFFVAAARRPDTQMPLAASPGDEAPLARQETMAESVGEYDDISVTTLLDLDTSTPAPCGGSLGSEPSRPSLGSRRSWVSLAWRGPSLSSAVVSLEPLGRDQLFERSVLQTDASTLLAHMTLSRPSGG